MYRVILSSLLIGSFTISSADSAIQTDWSGGPGEPGPVVDWGVDYYSDSGICCYSCVGDIRLSLYMNQNYVADYHNPGPTALGDIDQDGDLDVVCGTRVCTATGRLAWSENLDGTGSSFELRTIQYGNEVQYQAFWVGDIDGDIDVDIAYTTIYYPTPNTLGWWENTDGLGGAWTQHIIDEDLFSALSIDGADIDGDGDTDLVVSEMDAGIIAWWENDGSALIWTKNMIAAGSSFWCAACGDIDCDGDIDIAYTNASAVGWIENADGIGATWVLTEIGLLGSSRQVEIVDIDLNGSLDVLANSASMGGTDNKVVWWSNDDSSGTTWTYYIVDDDFSRGVSLGYGDFDGDNDTDIVGSASSTSSDPQLALWENLDGYGTSWADHPLESGYPIGPRCLSVGDIDGDMIPEIVGMIGDHSGGYPREVIYWWDHIGYPDNGNLESSVLYIGCDPQWSNLNWSCTTPASTSLAFQIRASDDPGNLGGWSDTLYSPCSLDAILDDSDSYIQYKVILLSSNPLLTPSLHDVTVTWDPLGIEEGDSSLFGLLLFSPNPTTAPKVRFTLPEPANVDITIFDQAGRNVSEIIDSEYPAGYHILLLGELTPGIYFCRMISGDFIATQRFVVIE